MNIGCNIQHRAYVPLHGCAFVCMSSLHAACMWFEDVRVLLIDSNWVLHPHHFKHLVGWQVLVKLIRTPTQELVEYRGISDQYNLHAASSIAMGRVCHTAKCQLPHSEHFPHPSKLHCHQEHLMCWRRPPPSAPCDCIKHCYLALMLGARMLHQTFTAVQHGHIHVSMDTAGTHTVMLAEGFQFHARVETTLITTKVSENESLALDVHNNCIEDNYDCMMSYANIAHTGFHKKRTLNMWPY